MRNLTLADLGEGLADLLDNRTKFLEATQTGKLYGPILAAKRKAIDHALKVVLETKAGDLSETDMTSGKLRAKEVVDARLRPRPCIDLLHDDGAIELAAAFG